MADWSRNLLAMLMGVQQGQQQKQAGQAEQFQQMLQNQLQQQQLGMQGQRVGMERERLDMDLAAAMAPPPPAVPPEWTADLQALQAGVDPNLGPNERFDYYRQGLASNWSGTEPFESFFGTFQKPPSPFTLSPGQTRFAGGGEEIAGVPPTPPTPPAAARRTIFKVPYDEFKATWDFVRSYSPSSISAEELMQAGADPLVQLAMLQKTGGRTVPENLKPQYTQAVSWLKGVFNAYYTNQPLGGEELWGTVDKSGNLTRSR